MIAPHSVSSRPNVAHRCVHFIRGTKKTRFIHFLSSLAHFYARIIARPRCATATLRIASNLHTAHLLLRKTKSGVWLLLPLTFWPCVARLMLRDAAEVPLHSCWRSCELCASRLRSGSGRVALIDSPHLLIDAAASPSCFEWLRARRLRRVWRMGVV